MALAFDPKRTTLLLLDFQHDNITATPGIADKRIHTTPAAEEPPVARVDVSR